MSEDVKSANSDIAMSSKPTIGDRSPLAGRGFVRADPVSEDQIGRQSQLVGDLLFPTITRTTLASLIIGYFMAHHPLGIIVTNSKLTVRCDPTLDTVQYLGSDRAPPSKWTFLVIVKILIMMMKVE